MRPVSRCALVAMVVLAAGCPNPNVYGTARTVPKGDFQHTIAAEGVAVVDTPRAAETPTLPTYQLRYGLADTVDMGFRLANLTSLGWDLKWNFLRGSRVDLAAAPGFTGTYVSSGNVSAGVVYFNLPLILGLHVTDSTTLVVSPGLGAVVATQSVPSSSGSVQFNGASSLYARAGIGLNIRATAHFALQPEVTALKSFDGVGEILSLGLGFSFGAMPRSPSELQQGDEARTRAMQLAQQAEEAASAGDCSEIELLDGKIRALDAGVHASLVAQADVAGCIALAQANADAVAEEERQACLERRREAGQAASAIADPQERGRALLALPVCAPPRAQGPVVDPVFAQKVKVRQRELELASSAVAAAKARDCAAVAKLDIESAQLDPRFHSAVFVRDGAIATCLQSKPTVVDQPVAPVPAPAPAPQPAVEPQPPTRPVVEPEPAPAQPPPPPPPVSIAPEPKPQAVEHATPPTRTPIDEAEAHLVAGQELLDRRQYAEAVLELDHAYQKWPLPKALYYQAEAYRLMNDPPRALVKYRAFVAASPEGNLADAARARVGELERPAPAPASAEPVAAAPQPAAPQAPPSPPTTAPPAATAIDATPTPRSSSWSARRRFALATAGAGVVALGIGAWAGIDAQSLRDQARKDGCSADLSQCPGSALSTARDAYSRGNLATTLFVTSGLLVGAGVALWLTDTPPSHGDRTSLRVAPGVAPGRAGLVLQGGF